jgi:maltooligosyltrehalose trehalohydrolase
MVRAFFIENALHWVHEYHFDGLRLDATHALIDESERPFLAELSERVRATVSGREVLLIAEDHRNLVQLVRGRADGGWGLDAVWADDFHHQIRRALAGDHEGYYADYSGAMVDVAATLRGGWFYTGQYSPHFRGPRGTDPRSVAPQRFVICLQNHDQIGNRALGERLHQQIDLAAYRAAVVLLLCAPETPLLFMGQEWAASTPFLYFTDHQPELGRLVTAGRRNEFIAFAAFKDRDARTRIPDPQDVRTAEMSRLEWSEIGDEPHASVLRLHRALLVLRRNEPALQSANWAGFGINAVGEHALVLHRTDSGSGFVAVVRLRGTGAVPLTTECRVDLASRPVLSTEDPAFSPDPKPIRLDRLSEQPQVHFKRPGAVLLRASFGAATLAAPRAGAATLRDDGFAN